MANATIIYACTPDGLYILNKPGTLPQWLPPRHVLAGQAIAAAWAEPGPPIRVLAAASPPVGLQAQPGSEAASTSATHAAPPQPGQLLLSENGGREWSVALNATVTALLESTTEGGKLYAGMDGGGLAASIDGGVTWGILPSAGQGGKVRALLESAGEPGRFFALLEYEGGETEMLHGGPGDEEWRVLQFSGAQALAQDTGIGDLYAAAPDGIYISADRGVTWVPLPGSPPGGVCIAAIPGPQNSPPALIVGTPTTMYASPDGGGSWQELDLEGPVAVTSLVRDPERRDRLYAGTASGTIMESGNRGQSWDVVNPEPVGSVSAMSVIRI